MQRLISEGFLVDEAENGLVGLEKAKSQPIDLVVLDLNMPEMGGLEALPLILESKPKLPVIIHSKYGTHKDDFQSWSASAFIVKNPDGDLTELVTVINQQLFPKIFQ